MGAHDIKNPSGSLQVHRVNRIIRNKDYNPETFVNDIAILTLETLARISNSVKPNCLPTDDRSYSNFVNQKVTVNGWGPSTALEWGKQSSVLRKVDLTIISTTNVLICTKTEFLVGSKIP